MSFLDLSGLSVFLSKIQNVFAPISHQHTKSDITDLIDTTDDLLQSVYPVGSIYMTTTNIDPADLFGFGTWTQIKDTFLLAAGDTYNAGSTGGEAEHTLTIDEIPSHNHENNYPAVNPYNGTGSDSGYSWQTSSDNWGYQSDKLTGGGQAHNNMPPYLTVYVWKRTA